MPNPPHPSSEPEAANAAARRYVSVRKQLATPGAPTDERSRVDPGGPGVAVPTRLRLITLADVEPEEVEWLWPGYVPLGKLTVLEGDPGLGKSLLTIALAAAVSTGDYSRLPGGANRPPRDVFFVTYEDGLRDTIRGRVEAAGADLSRVHVIEGVRRDDGGEDLVTFPDDVPDLERLAHQRLPGLVVVDPLSAALNARIDSHKDQDVRRGLAPIARFAETAHTAVQVVRHLNKGGSRSAILTGGGSIGIAGAARCVLVVGPHEGDAARNVLAVVKCNLAVRSPSLLYAIESCAGQPIITWHGTTSVTADDLSVARADGATESGAGTERDLATACLREWLTGGAVPKADIAKLAREQGIAERTLQRAAQTLGVKYARWGQGREHRVVWTLPELASTTHSDQSDAARTLEHFNSTRAMTPPSESGASHRGASGAPQLNLDGRESSPRAIPENSVTRATAPSTPGRGASGNTRLTPAEPSAADRALDKALEDEAARAREGTRSHRAQNGGALSTACDDGNSDWTRSRSAMSTRTPGRAQPATGSDSKDAR